MMSAVLSKTCPRSVVDSTRDSGSLIVGSNPAEGAIENLFLIKETGFFYSTHPVEPLEPSPLLPLDHMEPIEPVPLVPCLKYVKSVMMEYV